MGIVSGLRNHPRLLEVAYRFTDSIFSRLDPVLRKVGYARADSWLRWYQNFGQPFKIADAPVAGIDDLSRKLRKRLSDAAGVIQLLKEAAEDEVQ